MGRSFRMPAAFNDGVNAREVGQMSESEKELYFSSQNLR
jgi:hypothetical protein